MKRVFLTLITVALTMLSSTKSFAYDCEVDGIYYYRVSTSELEVTNKVFSDQNRSAYTGTVNIPSTVTYNGRTFTVVSIGEYAFRDCSQITSVSIPATVKSIKGFAFYNCSQMTKVNIPATVSFIGSNAFEGCSSITSLQIPNGITTVEDNTFYGCSALKTVIVPSTVSSVGAEAFARCYALMSVYLGSVTPPSCQENAFDKVDRTWVTLYVPKSSEGYNEDKVWKDFFIDEFDGSVDSITLPTKPEK